MGELNPRPPVDSIDDVTEACIELGRLIMNKVEKVRLSREMS